MVSFKKTAVVSVEITPRGYRQDTAACVSLSRSTISKTQEPENRSHRLAPGCGGGGDVVASPSPVKRSFRRRPPFSGPARRRGRRCLAPHFSASSGSFLKKNLSLQTTPEGGGGGGSPGGRISASTGLFSHPADRRPKPSGRKKPSGKPERLASVSPDDSIGARNLTETP